MRALFDTHCHLDASEFDADRDEVIGRAATVGVRGILIPAVQASDFDKVRRLAHGFAQGAYAVGIHPMYVHQASDSDLQSLKAFLQAHRDDPRLVAVGEIGLDFFVAQISQGEQRNRQIRFYQAQLDLAMTMGLPVILHVRRSQDELLKWLRRRPLIGGIAHAFNGSLQQAQQFIDAGFALGVGGAFTFTRAKQIRRLVTTLSLSNLVLETDSPDMAPAWLEKGSRNTPYEVAQIAAMLAQLRHDSLDHVLHETSLAAKRVIPKLGPLWMA
ncbi:TatD family hydrolase [Orrella daihaiensis]|uniref:TatD family hydrolase n=1 Tax=Orrella daihaiensis TaxID=2782176 RepID=A0ABY4AG70_9BURK|nr:TatD family hydrolase [Orrella daihaiensis]UOD49289.1 TatD family hydrolase [Orrella daihaiensis]